MNSPILMPIGRRRWAMVKDWTGYGVTIPQGFDTDLASIPSALEWLIHRNELHWIIPGIIHDYRYRTQTISRRKADKELREIAILEGAPQVHAWIVWIGVTFGGYQAWQSRKP